MTEHEPVRNSRSDMERTRAAWRDALPVTAVLGLAVVAMFVFDHPGLNAGTVVWAVLLLTAGGLGIWAEVRSLRRADEYQRLQQLQAHAVGFGVVVMLLLVVSLLAAAQLMDPRQGMQISLIGGLLAWEVIRAVKARKA